MSEPAKLRCRSPNAKDVLIELGEDRFGPYCGDHRCTGCALPAAYLDRSGHQRFYLRGSMTAMGLVMQPTMGQHLTGLAVDLREVLGDRAEELLLRWWL